MRKELSRREAMRDTAAALGALALGGAAAGRAAEPQADPTKDWLPRWEKKLLDSARSRYCDKETGEEIGWLISPFLNGFAYGYLATGDAKWLEMLLDWADAWLKRGVKEPDGYVGWPKAGSGGAYTKDLLTDSQLGEAMGLQPLALAADAILKSPALKAKHGAKAEEFIKLNEQTFEKWDSRFAWREAKEGGVWIVPPFGIDPKTGKWSEGYEQRKTDGFSHPANKQNFIACWLITLHDVTKKPVYKERAEKWWRQMKSRLRTRDDGKYYVWNYWDPAGPWDSKPDGSLRHWVGVHPNGGYYGIDVEGIACAYEHGLVFAKDDIDRLIATNRDFMWNQKVEGAAFKRIDGGEPDKRWAKTPGVLWAALVPYDATLRKVFEANHDPAGWGGLSSTPWYLAKYGPGAGK